jgi:flagellar L-ring protein precursor FlgH
MVSAIVTGLVLLGASTAAQEAEQAAEAHPALAGPLTNEDYDELFQRFLDVARRQDAAAVGVDYGWMTDLSLDVRARRVNDLVTVRVIENISGAGAADSALSQSSSGLASLTNYFGLENILPDSLDPSSLVDTLSDTDFEGGGTTNRSGTLNAIVTTRVAEVLPNGDLVLEGVREVVINGDRQMLLLTGIARQEDIGPNNVVLSPAVGQLRIRYFGEGLMKDSLEPGWLTKILNKIF